MPRATWSYASCALSLKAVANQVAQNAAAKLALISLLVLLALVFLGRLWCAKDVLITALSLRIRRGWNSAIGEVDSAPPAMMDAVDAQPMEKLPPPVAQPRHRRGKKKKRAQKLKGPALPQVEKSIAPKTLQPFDAFLVLDVEATCQQGSSFDYPNEIIELPVYLMRWTDKTKDGRASRLEIVDKFHSFVRPTWRPVLSDFCMQLTGITQESIDSAPTFSAVLDSLRQFLVNNGLLNSETSQPLTRFCWCTDGPHDIRDFFVKQCFISQVDMPNWIRGDVVDVRSTVVQWMAMQSQKRVASTTTIQYGVRRPLTIPLQLQALGLPPFEGRQHCGMDDARNVATIVTELARKDIRLQPNTPIHPNRRWLWMGKPGQILEVCG